MNPIRFPFEIFDESSDLVYGLNSEGIVCYANLTLKNALGYSFDTLKSIPNKKLFADYTYLESILRKTDKEGKASCNFDLICKSGTYLPVKGLSYIYKAGDHQDYVFVLQPAIDRIRFEKIENFFSRISNLVLESENSHQLYSSIHTELQKILAADNFFIALIQDGNLTFPYYVDNKLTPKERPFKATEGRGLSEYVLFKDQPTLLYPDGILDLIEAGKLYPLPEIPSIWMGTPLKLEGETIGLIAVTSYKEDADYQIEDLDILSFVSGQVALAISRKIQLEEINTQASRLQSIFESSRHISWTINKKMEFTSFNNNFQKLYSYLYGIKPYLNKPIESTSFIKDWKGFFDQVWRGESFNFEYEHPNVNNDTEWKDIYLNPIKFHNQIEEISAIGLDITEKKQTLIRLKESEEKFRNIYESFQDIYFRCTLSGKLEMISPSVSELTGYSSQFLRGRDITNFYLYSQRTKDLIRRLIKERSVRNFEASVIKKDGQIFSCLCNVRLLKDPEKNTIFIEGVARDITTIKQINNELVKAKELAEHSLKIKEQFLANMSHELRTPMNGIIGMVDLLDDSTDPSEKKEYISTIKKSSQTLMVILNDILDLSKIEAGKVIIRESPASVADLLEKVYALFSQLAKQKNITFTIDKSDEIPEILALDETRVIQILSNLVSNAIKFTPENGKVSVKATEQSDYLKFQIQDTGIGIKPEDRERLFSNFTQLDNSTTKSFSGTGLGLAISKNLTHLMNGEIGVESEWKKGSNFWFKIPLKAAKKVVKRGNGFSFKISINKNLKGKHILLVDDNQINQQVANEILKKAGAATTIVYSGKMAMEKIKKINFDLIFMDIQMPELDGIETTELIRQSLRDQTPPIVAMTAYSMSDDRDLFVSKGMDDYISKPIRPNQLIAMAEKWILGKHPEASPHYEAEESEKASKVFNLNIPKQLESIGGQQMITSVYHDFIEETKEMIKLNQNLLQYDRQEEIKINLHTLKGNAGTLGAEELAELVTSIEKKLKSGEKKASLRDLERIKTAFDNFSNIFEQYLERIKQYESGKKSVDS